MHVQWAIPCRYVETTQGAGATIIGAGSDIVLLPSLPSPVQLTFAVRYVGEIEELDGISEHPISCRVFDSNGDKVGEQRAKLKAEAIAIVPGLLAELTVPTTLVLEVKRYGTYRVEFSIDDGATLDVPIHFVDQRVTPGT